MGICKITESVRDNFPNIFDEKIGIVNEIFEFSNPLNVPLHSYYAVAKSGNQELYNGSGIGRDRDVSLSKAIGECLERYCLSNIDEKKIIYTNYNSILNRYPCVCHKKVQIYTLDELNSISFRLYNESDKTLFCLGYNVTKGFYEHIPMSMIYLNSNLKIDSSKKANIIQQSISTGAAFGVEFYQTALTGIYEVIERDAMMAFWLLGQEAYKIQINDLQINLQDLIKKINDNEIKVDIFDISVDNNIFVILASFRSDNLNMPAAVFSAASHHDLFIAIQKAIEEVILTFGLAENLLRTNSAGYHSFLNPQEWIKHVSGRNDHVKFWSYHEIFDKFGFYLDFIFKSSKIASIENLIKKNKIFSDDQSAFLSIVNALESSGYEILLVDISTPDIEKFGFMTLKAIIPGYLPLYLGHRFIYRRPKRLVDIAESYQLDFEKIQINETPHPFP